MTSHSTNDARSLEDEGSTAGATGGGDLADRILAAVIRGGKPASYEDCADVTAGMILLLYQARPEVRSWPVTGQPDLYAEVDAFTDGKLSGLGITGFMWGWAVNAARHCFELPPVPNPAIITLGRSENDA